MATNTKSGLKRLAIAVLVPWFGYWALLGIGSYRTLERINTEISEPNLPSWRSDMLLQLNATATGNLQDALGYGLVYPIVALIIGCIGYWVYRGFKPKVAEAND